MKTYKIACIPGDGIGKEVVPAGQTVLEALAAASNAFNFEFENFGWGGDWYRAHGEMMPKDGLEPLRNKDAILFGSAGDRGYVMDSGLITMSGDAKIMLNDPKVREAYLGE